MQMGHLAGPLFHFVNIAPHAAGDATQDHVVFRAWQRCRLRRVTIVPAAAITGANTNEFNLNVKTWTAAGVATERANRDYVSGTNEAAMVARDLYAPATPLGMALGDSVTVERELIGTGIASPNIGVLVEYDLTN